MTDAAQSTPTPVPISLKTLREKRKPLRNVNVEVKDNYSALDRLALWITTRVGTMGFFFIIFIWTFVWLTWNFLAPKNLQFDPPMAFVFWLFISNMVQIFLMPLIMIGQNLQGAHAEARAENDLEVNVKAEKEIEVILQHLEYQNEMIISMVKTLGCETGGAAPAKAKAAVKPAAKPAPKAAAKAPAKRPARPPAKK